MPLLKLDKFTRFCRVCRKSFRTPNRYGKICPACDKRKNNRFKINWWNK